VKPKDSRNSGGALFHAPPSLAACGFTRRRKKLQKQGGSGLTSSSQSPYAGGDLQSNRKHHMQLILIFLSFSDLFRSSPFQICITADLLFVYIFFSFASGGRQLGGVAMFRGRR